MCTKECNCATVIDSQWQEMGYSIKGYNFTGSIVKVETCLNYTLYNENVVDLMRVLET